MAGRYTDDNNRDRWRDADRERSSYGRDRDEDRGFFERAGDEIRSWFGEDDDRRARGDFDRGYGRSESGWSQDRDFGRSIPPRNPSWERDQGRAHFPDRDRERDIARESRSNFGGMAQGGVSQRDYGRRSDFDRNRDRSGPSARDFGGFRDESDFRNRSESRGHRGQGRWERERDESESSLGYGDFRGTLGGFGNQMFGSSQDDHYRSWRDRQLQQLDRDYEDYCREREQQFHSDFDSWRSNRPNLTQGQPGPGSSGDLGVASNAGVGTTTSSISGTAGKGSAAGSGSSGGSSIQADTAGSTETAGTGSGSGRSGSRSRS